MCFPLQRLEMFFTLKVEIIYLQARSWLCHYTAGRLIFPWKFWVNRTCSEGPWREQHFLNIGRTTKLYGRDNFKQPNILRPPRSYLNNITFLLCPLLGLVFVHSFSKIFICRGAIRIHLRHFSISSFMNHLLRWSIDTVLLSLVPNL